jgi:hypothetical protein
MIENLKCKTCDLYKQMSNLPMSTLLYSPLSRINTGETLLYMIYKCSTCTKEQVKTNNKAALDIFNETLNEGVYNGRLFGMR